MIEIKPVVTVPDEKKFRDFTDELYEGCEYYVPLLKLDLKGYMSRKHPFYKNGEAQFFLAYKDGRVSGRICAYENKKYNNYHKQEVGFFGSFESINDQAVAHALLEAAKIWLKGRGLMTMRGSRDYYSDEPQGILIDGFNTLSPVPLSYHHPYYQTLFENEGFEKHSDYYAYETPDLKTLPFDRGARVLKRVSERSGVTFKPLDKKSLDKEIEKAVELFNIFEVVNGENFIPVTFDDVKYFVTAMKPLLIPDFCYFAEHQGQTVGMIVAIPDAHELLRTVRHGRLLPFGIFKLLRIKSFPYKRLRIVLLGMREEYQKTGLGAALGYLVTSKAVSRGYKSMDMSMIDENNTLMINVAQNMGGIIYKTYRLYQKGL